MQHVFVPETLKNTSAYKLIYKAAGSERPSQAALEKQIKEKVFFRYIWASFRSQIHTRTERKKKKVLSASLRNATNTDWTHKAYVWSPKGQLKGDSGEGAQTALVSS